MKLSISEVRYTPNSPHVLITWRAEGGLFRELLDSTTTTQEKLQARVTNGGAWGDDEVLAEVRADIAVRAPGEQHTVSLPQQPPQLYPTFEPVVPESA